MNNKTELSIIFNYCLDVLRDNEHLTGDKALRTLAHILDLRLLEPQFKKTIDIDNYEYDFSSYEDNIIEKHKKKLLSVVRFSNLVKEKEENIPKIMKCLWDEILSVHPTTKNIFLKGKSFDIQNQSTFKKLINKLNTFDFESIDEDVLGEAYEEVIKNIMTGKVLGQFFTPPNIKNMMIKLVNPQIKKDGTIEKIFDPAMGTGGFLISSLRYLVKQSKEKEINLNWNFITNEGLGGREAEPDTYQLAISNMLISSGYMFNVIEKGDSIKDPITKKYDIILANPPFGIDGLNYNEISDPLRDKYLPIKSNSAVPLFLQAIIYMLKLNGRCAIVLPTGKDLFIKGNELESVREYLLKTCDLKEIYFLPSVFSHTPILTCVFYFIKKKECLEVLNVDIKISKSKKESKRIYNFIKDYSTKNVKFYNYNPENEKKDLFIEVSIDKISNNGHSLNYSDYLENNNKNYKSNIEIKNLDELCDIDYGTRIVKKNNTEGEYPVFGSGRQMFTTNSYNRDGFNILIGRFGLSLECVRLVNQRLFLNDSGLSVKPKTDKVLHKYIAYYLLENQSMIYECARGPAQKNLEMEKFKNLKIPLPSIKNQEIIIKKIENINEENNELRKKIEENINKSKNIISNVIIKE